MTAFSIELCGAKVVGQLSDPIDTRLLDWGATNNDGGVPLLRLRVVVELRAANGAVADLQPVSANALPGRTSHE
jgi:hypothetical protein